MIDRCYLEITNRCNLHCTFCVGHHRPSGLLSDQHFDLLTDRLAGHVRFLYFHLMGEPLLHPSLPQFITASQRKGFVPILTTNGTLLPSTPDEPLWTQLLAAHPYKINISLHAADGNPRLSAPAFVSHILPFALAAAEAGIIVILRLWNRIDDVTTPDTESDIEGTEDPLVTLVRQHVPMPWTPRTDGWRLRNNLFIEYDRRFRWPDVPIDDGSFQNTPRKEASDELFCHALRNQIGIHVDGTVVPCCLDHDADIPLGNLLTTPLEEVLSSPRAQALYEGFTRHQPVEELCRHCGYAAEKRFHSR